MFSSGPAMSLPAYLLVAGCAARLPPHEASVKHFFAGSRAAVCSLGHGPPLHCLVPGLGPGSGPMGRRLALMGPRPSSLERLLPLLASGRLQLRAPAGGPVTSIKSAALFLLMRLASLGPASALAACLPWVGAISALYGSLLALRQVRLQRLLAYSSVSHAGVLVLGVGAWAAQRCEPAAAAPLFFYGLVYLFMSNGAFLFLRHSGLSQRGDAAGYGKMRPIPAALFAVLLLSLAGIPPTGGFLAKLLIFWEAVKAGLYLPVAMAALASLVGLGYYLGLVRDMFFDEPVWRASEPEAGAVRWLLWSAPWGRGWACCPGVLPSERLFSTTWAWSSTSTRGHGLPSIWPGLFARGRRGTPHETGLRPASPGRGTSPVLALRRARGLRRTWPCPSSRSTAHPRSETPCLGDRVHWLVAFMLLAQGTPNAIRCSWFITSKLDAMLGCEVLHLPVPVRHGSLTCPPWPRTTTWTGSGPPAALPRQADGWWWSAPSATRWPRRIYDQRRPSGWWPSV